MGLLILSRWSVVVVGGGGQWLVVVGGGGQGLVVVGGGGRWLVVVGGGAYLHNAPPYSIKWTIP